HRHDQHGGDDVQDICDLHDTAGINQTRHQHVQHEAGSADDQAQSDHTKPEPYFFTGIEATGTRMTASEHATEPDHPVPVTRTRQIVAHINEEEYDDRNGEYRSDKVMDGLQDIGERTKYVVTEDR